MAAIIRLFLCLILSLSIVTHANAGPRKIYLVNGILSTVLGYGLRNLSKKISGDRYFQFTGGVPQSTINGIIADASNAYARDNSTKIALVGISAGANAVTQIASALAKRNVPVAYLGVIEGGKMSSVKSNVARADSFICTGSTCKSKRVPKAAGNNVTKFSTIKLNTSHVDSANSPRLHSRVLAQINAM